jgi:hypothetical protein
LAAQLLQQFGGLGLGINKMVGILLLVLLIAAVVFVMGKLGIGR